MSCSLPRKPFVIRAWPYAVDGRAEIGCAQILSCYALSRLLEPLKQVPRIEAEIRLPAPLFHRFPPPHVGKLMTRSIRLTDNTMLAQAKA